MGTLYARAYIGHEGRFGHEWLEFELHPDGTLLYSNETKYRGEKRIRKELKVSSTVQEEFCRIIRESKVLQEDDSRWPMPDASGKQELEVFLDGEHVSFATHQIGSLHEVENSSDPIGLGKFYYLMQDLKCFVLSLTSLHFKIKPI